MICSSIIQTDSKANLVNPPTLLTHHLASSDVKLAAILEKNNVQIICPGHKISPSVRENFPIRHVLNEEVSTDGRIRVNVKTSAKDEIMDKIDW